MVNTKTWLSPKEEERKEKENAANHLDMASFLKLF